jgi:hypothetical protein
MRAHLRGSEPAKVYESAAARRKTTAGDAVARYREP